MTQAPPKDAQFQIAFVSGPDAGQTKYYKTTAAVNAAMKRISRQNAKAQAEYWATPHAERVEFEKIAFVVSPVTHDQPVSVESVRI